MEDRPLEQPLALWRDHVGAGLRGPRGLAAQSDVARNCLRSRRWCACTHGGGNVDGESNDYDGSKLANGAQYGGKDTVVVTINYRLGLLGFFADPALDGEGHDFG
ncbi:MAG: carboxylesterase family protein, partial [Solirubrobacterales bacterium]|nr:carboxylesterase family protein [Solirubrobacterales bacterium]